MSDWHWRIITLTAVLVLTTCFVSYLRADDTVQKLPFCNPHAAKDIPTFNDLVIVSTLDGKVTAFSTDNGIKVWTLETQPLLSSNLHQVELTADGKWARLVPSLRGTLYSLSGESIEPLPFNAEQLLSASFKYSDDLVIAGARETLWVGVDAHSGKIIYECSSSGCNSEQETASAGRDIIVLRRHSNTVRALEPRSGTEKWNFSVAEHQLALSRRECAGTGGPPAALAVAVALPEGVVAVRRPGSHSLLWQHKLESPVAGMWRLQGGLLENMDVLWEAAQSITDANTATSPSLYLGVHNTQIGGRICAVIRKKAVTNNLAKNDLYADSESAKKMLLDSLTHKPLRLMNPKLYIQESVLYAKKLETSISIKPVPWKLKQARPLIEAPHDTALSHPDPTNLAVITLHGNSGKTENLGFFLYLQDTCDQAVQVSEDTIEGPDIVLPNNSDDQSSHHHVHVHVYSLWFWWKEVLLIAVSSAILMNLMIWPRFFAPRFRAPTPLPMNQEYIVVERHYERPPSISNEYSHVARYENEFTTLRCLGRGGFGVVFEARNNIDHRSYAVKRITLPKRESKRERVLREVRALAMLEHEHIVRYFNSWLEEPPPRWQQTRDHYWISQLEGETMPSEEYTSYTPASPAAKSPSAKKNSVLFNVNNPIDDCMDALDYEKKLSEPRRLRSSSCNESFSIIFDDDASKDPRLNGTLRGDVTSPSKRTPSGDDSFIVFANTADLSDTSQGKKDTSSHDTSKHVTSSHDTSKHVTPSHDTSKRVTSSRDMSSHDVPRKDVSNRILEKVKECDTFNDNNSSSKKKKKGHTRHWSLDMVVRPTEDNASSKMYLYIQMQLCRRDSLHDWLRTNYTWEARRDHVKTLFSQIVSAVEYVHLMGLIHRDLKPSNIFFSLDGKVKVGDFGLATAMTDSQSSGDTSANTDIHTRHTHKVGTFQYMSPEQIKCRPYNYKVDIYSLGLILFEMLYPFTTEAERTACLSNAKSGKYSEDFQMKYPNETEVLKLMLSEEPELRPTASGVRARAPLYQDTDTRWHFTLPTLISG